ncbi:hypothetical protein, partial [Aeromonas dhakensis]|uniref:hypothetical protein n=1 Tax=Aeromonas dhakensis TaxID=196024 RepID=UPI003FA0F2EB
IAHGNLENTQLAILDGLDQVVNKGRPLPMYVVNLHDSEAQEAPENPPSSKREDSIAPPAL